MSDCCTPDGSCSTSTTQSATTAVADSHTTVYAVSGMTCGHCKTTLTKAIGGMDHVLGVDVDVDAGLVTVTSAGDLDGTELAAVIDDAGYKLTGVAV